MQKKTPAPLDLSEAEMKLVERYAEGHGITVDQAATQLAKQAISARYVIPIRRDARVMTLPVRRR